MGRKSAHSGMSPKDRSINLMDKFIQRNDRRNKDNPVLPAIRKDAGIPINLWPLKDQIEYWDSRTAKDKFDDKYPTYSYWIDSVQTISNVHPRTFSDWTLKLKPKLLEFFNSKMIPKDAVLELRKLGIY